MSDVRESELPSAGEIPPRPDRPLAQAVPENPARPPADREDEMRGSDQHGTTAVRPFEPIATGDEADLGLQAPPPPTSDPVAPPVPTEESVDEPAAEPKRRWRRKRKQSAPEPAAEVPLEQGHAESVPGPRGMFGSDATTSSPGPDVVPPMPTTADPPAMMTRPDVAPATDFERETAPAPDAAPEPEPEQPRGPVIRPLPGHYRLPDDFAFGPGAKPDKAKRGS